MEMDEKSGQRKSKKFRFSWKLGILLFLGFLAAGVVCLWTSIPDVSSLKMVNPRQTAFMRYRMRQDPKMGIPDLSWTRLEHISPFLVQAVLIAEDDKFFQHEGFDWESMRQAAESNLKKRKVIRGGSTITQQLAKNLYLSPSRSPVRKIREMAIAFIMEKKLTKKRILEMYLNVVEWGKGTFGVTAASRHYFGMSPALLSAAQSIRMVSVLPNPIRFRVLADGNSRMNKKRRKIAERMFQRHLISSEDFDRVLAELGLSR